MKIAVCDDNKSTINRIDQAIYESEQEISNGAEAYFIKPKNATQIILNLCK